MLWLGIVGAVGLYLYSSRPAPPAAFAWLDNLDRALAYAAQRNQLILLQFHAAWCGPCREMDREVFTRAEVAEILAGWTPVHIDVDQQPQVASRFGVESVPTFFVLSPHEGRPLVRFEGALSAKDFITFLQAAQKQHRPSPRASN